MTTMNKLSPTVSPPPDADLVKLYRDNAGLEVKHSAAGAVKFMQAAFALGAQAQQLQQNADADNTREDVDRFAKEMALNAVTSSDENRAYILQAKAKPEEFVVHQWVLDAIKQAYRYGVLQRDHNNEFILHSVERQHEQEKNGIVRATAAALMEAHLGHVNDMLTTVIGKKKTVTLHVDLDAQRTIWDRATLESELTENNMLGKKYIRYTFKLK